MKPSDYAYLVVVDDTPEAQVALRFAARRAAEVGARVALLVVIAPTEFIPFGGLQDAIEAEAREKAEALLAVVSDRLAEEAGHRPSIEIRTGDLATEVLAAIKADPSIRRLVLAAAASGAPGPLVSFFAGEASSALPCPVIIIPGALTDDRFA